jgi:hypothetical protein
MSVSLKVMVLAVMLGACSGGNGQTPDAGDGSDGGDQPFQLRGACSMETRLGGFLIEALEDYSIIDGKVADGVVPASILEEVLQEEGCRLLRKRNPVCDPPCQAGETCDFDGSCIPYPLNQDVGIVSITGLKKAVEMEPRQPGNNYFDTDLPNPVFDPGSEIELTSTEGHFGRLALYGMGVEILVIETGQWNIEEGQSLDITWEPPTAQDKSMIDLQLNIDQHGTTPVVLRCGLDDSGSASIPATLIDALLQSGVSGFPNGRLTRRTADSMQVEEGCVELLVSSPVTPKVRVAGHIPCKSDADCPSGQTCDLATQTCR